MKKYKYNKKYTYDNQTFYIHADTLEELGEKKANKIASLKEKKQAESNVTVREWAETCIEAYKTGQADSTRRIYKYRVNHCILEYIGDMRLVDVTPLHCQKVLNHQAGKSKAHISEVSNALKFIFSHAAYNELIPKDPTIMLKKPKGTYNGRRALTEDERNIFLEVATTDRMYYGFLLMLYCGCRPLEAHDAKGSDIFDIDGQPMLHVRGTKTKNADRNVPIPPQLWEIIKKSPKSEFVALYKGKHINQDTRRRLWHNLWREMNIKAGNKIFRNQLLEPYVIPKDLTPYCLRHEFCSDLARKGIDIRIAQKLMGHSEISLTANIYTHVDNKDIISALGYGR